MTVEEDALPTMWPHNERVTASLRQDTPLQLPELALSQRKNEFLKL
jgi:hypothetical protein